MSSRRQILAILGAGGLATVAYRVFGGGGGMVARGLRWPRGITPAVTPDGDHYQVSKNVLFSDPAIDASRWRLDVHGLVSRPLSLSLDDLRAMPIVEPPATLACIGNTVPARAISTAVWQGVRLTDVLERAGMTAAATRDVVLIGADNYTDSIPLDRALAPGTILAFAMNGQPVPQGHGAPLRAIVPGIYGMKNVKWIEAIEVVGGDYLGYWQQRGWSDAAPYQTLSRIDEPRNNEELQSGVPQLLSGIAFAGDRGISRVALTINDVVVTPRLEPPLGPYTWVIWTHQWTPARSGVYEICVRAYDLNGAAQTDSVQPNFPNGATGLHRVVVSVA
jgi:DMSO/TMAO reductase YedYZ molybdopterin-dependent catalytic subunit